MRGWGDKLQKPCSVLMLAIVFAGTKQNPAARASFAHRNSLNLFAGNVQIQPDGAVSCAGHSGGHVPTKQNGNDR